MKSFKDAVKNMKRGPTDAVGIDVGTSGIKAVRMQKSEKGATVSAVDILPAVDLSGGESVASLELPARLRAKHGCLTLASDTSIVKLLTFPGAFDAKAEGKLVDNMGVEDASKFRIGYKIITEGQGRSESRVLTVAMPDEVARLAPLLLPSGCPVPYSIEVSGLSSMTTLLRAVEVKHGGEAVAAVDFGANISTFAIFNKGVLALVRRFSFGTQIVLDKVKEKLGVDAETAGGIILDGSFDISQPLAEVMDPLVKQLVVSRDFVERRENCHIGKLYLCGGLAASNSAVEELRSSIEVDVDRWDPFEGLQLSSDAIPENLAAQRWRFSAAVGACLGAFEEQ